MRKTEKKKWTSLMEQCRGGCSHEMVNFPTTATMASPREERRCSCEDDNFEDLDLQDPRFFTCCLQEEIVELNFIFPNSDLSNTRSSERRRKQSQPRRVLHQKFIIEEDSLISSDQNTNNNEKEMGIEISNLPDENMRQKSNFRSRRKFRCFSCPDSAPARGEISKPYHTKASLALHQLWRHNVYGKRKVFTCPVEEIQRQSITLKATVFTNASFDYRR